jgi:hypothetical protein
MSDNLTTCQKMQGKLGVILRGTPKSRVDAALELVMLALNDVSKMTNDEKVESIRYRITSVEDDIKLAVASAVNVIIKERL